MVGYFLNSNTWKVIERILRLQVVLKKLYDDGYNAGETKIEICLKQTVCMGHHISEDAIKPITEKTTFSKSYAPANTKNSFFGDCCNIIKILQNISRKRQTAYRNFGRRTRTGTGTQGKVWVKETNYYQFTVHRPFFRRGINFLSNGCKSFRNIQMKTAGYQQHIFLFHF